MDFVELEAFLTARLRQPLPGADTQHRFAPTPLRAGWRADARPSGARQAAALLLIYPGPRGLTVPLTVRHSDLPLHPGQVSLPGGRVDADGQHPAEELARLLERVRAGACDVAVGSRFASDSSLAAYRYKPTAARRFGTAVLRRSMKVALDKPFLDSTSGMYAANAKALPVLAQPYTSEAPEVQAILRLHEAGLRVDEVPVEMRARASGESKLQGKKAIMVVLTIAGTLLALERWRRR